MMSFGKKKMVPLKVLMALLIVASHLTSYVDIPWLRPLRELGAPIVSLFFFISGFGLYSSFQKRGRAYLNGFIPKKFARIIIPALIALGLYLLFLWSPNLDFGSAVYSFFRYGVPILPFSWFVVAIFYFYLLFYLCFRFLSGKLRSAGLLVGTLMYMAVTITIGFDRCWWISALAFPTGILFAIKEQDIYAFCETKRFGYATLLGSLTLLFFLLYLPRNPYLWTLCYILIPTIVALIVARLPLERMCVAPITTLHKVFYEIYLCQGIAMDLFKERIPIHSDWLYTLAVYATTIGLAFLVHALSNIISRPICASSTT